MILKTAVPEQLRRVYERDLKASFPSSELRPLPVIERACAEGRYRPWCAFDDAGEIAGELFLKLGNPGWALGDYLCVAAGRRNGGLGAKILAEVRRREKDLVILGEVEDPADAPDAEMARRRIGFYRRNGARFAKFRSEVFGVRYRLIYFSDAPVSEERMIREYGTIYRQDFSREKYEKFVRVPWTPEMPPAPKVAWI